MEPASKDTATATARKRRAKRAYLVLFVIASVVAGLWGVHRWMTKGKETTDDAQIEADILPVATRVSGTVLTTKVRDNQAVAKGDVLFELDPASFDIEVTRAEAELEAATASQAQADAQVAIVKSTSSGAVSSAKAAAVGASAGVRSTTESIRAAEAAVARAKADYATAQSDFARDQSLFGQQVITQRDLEHAQQTRDVTRASLDAATAQLAAAQSQRGMAQARVSEAQGRVTQVAPIDQQIAVADASARLAAARVKSASAALAKAKLDRSFAVIRAPSAGVISRLGVHDGQQVSVNQTLLMLVPDEVYVVANFKETQIRQMRPGNRVDIKLDAYEDELTGTVDTIAPATGARFSLLPPDNATGNFVKVVQRVPVKITFATRPSYFLHPGLSAEVTVHVE